MKSRTLPWLAALAPLLLGCATIPPGATDAHLAQAQTRAQAGSALFARACAGCHGPRGEGLAGAPPIAGVTGLPRYPRDQDALQLYQDPEQIQRQAQLRVPGAASRQQFVTAADVHAYLKQHTSEVKLPADVSELSDADVWAIVNFLLIAHGSDVPGAGITPDNASSISVRSE
jgi:mono/diheme cytochrome c family protein